MQLIPANVVKENGLTFCDRIKYIDGEGIMYGAKGKWSDDRICFKGWDRICRRNRLKEFDVVHCEMLHIRKKVHSIKITITRGRWITHHHHHHHTLHPSLSWDPWLLFVVVFLSGLNLVVLSLSPRNRVNLMVSCCILNSYYVMQLWLLKYVSKVTKKSNKLNITQRQWSISGVVYSDLYFDRRLKALD